ncbi:MAG: DUF3592 domain-containing protein [Ruminococcus flavefaciens]|nr:DUF3592 domain-containing protein [Ruminococcus flavefaciens]MCM1062550.1 DUF3592 domain-containing protein [Eubacterium sp.]
MRKTMYRTNNPKIVGTLFILFSILFIIVGIVVLMLPKIKSQKCTESVRAEVVENLQVESSDHRSGKVLYKPVFGFTYNGEDYRVESKTSSDPPAFRSGEIVELKINPDDPTDFYAPSDKTTGFIGIIFTGMGALFLTIGIVLRVVFKKNEKSESS